MEPQLPDLKPNRTDRIAAVMRGAAGLIPGAGSLVAELVNEVIPNQRVDRMEEFLAVFSARLEKLEMADARSKLQNPEAIDLFEDGVRAAARPGSSAYRQRIANLVAHGITQEEHAVADFQTPLRILEELNDVQFLMLKFYGVDFSEQAAFFEQHRAVLTSPLVHMGSDDRTLEDKAIFDANKRALDRLELIKGNFKKPKKGEPPELDPKTGMLKLSSYQITQLGRLVLKVAEGCTDEVA